VFSEFTRHCLGGPSVAKTKCRVNRCSSVSKKGSEFLILGQKAD
jgi:hypothetical protein